MNIFIIFLSVINFTKSFNIFNIYHNNLIEWCAPNDRLSSIFNFLKNRNEKIVLDRIIRSFVSPDYSKLKCEKSFLQFTEYNKSYNITLLKTSILSFMPMLKLHHIILLYDKKYDNIYTIDFSPINQTSPKILLKLLFNKNVNAEVRIRLVKNVILNDTNKIIEQWSNINKIDYITSQEITNKTYNKIYNNEIKDFIQFIINFYNKQGNYMNLYNNNCQTFSKFILTKF